MVNSFLKMSIWLTHERMWAGSQFDLSEMSTVIHTSNVYIGDESLIVLRLLLDWNLNQPIKYNQFSLKN
jgi:hypothetical protein